MVAHRALVRGFPVLPQGWSQQASAAFCRRGRLVIPKLGAVDDSPTRQPPLATALFVFTRRSSHPLPFKKSGISCSRGAPSSSRRLCAEPSFSFLCKSIHSGRLSPPSVLVALLSCAHCSGDTRPPIFLRTSPCGESFQSLPCAPPSCRSVSPKRAPSLSLRSPAARVSASDRRWACVDSMVRPTLASLDAVCIPVEDSVR